jgi:sphingomyelin phosphodiesterase acid-like 3
MNQSDILQQVFPNHIVYAAMGNHDWSPKGQLPPRPDPFYDDIAEKWEPWLDENATKSFRKGYIIHYYFFLKIIL